MRNYDAARRVVVKTAGKRRGGRLRRGTPRRYVLRETGELGLNRRIPKGEPPRRKSRTGSIFMESLSPSCAQTGFNLAIPFLEDRSDAACRVVVKTAGERRGGR